MDKKVYILCLETELDKIMRAFYDSFGIEYTDGGNTLTLNNNPLKVEISMFSESLGDDCKAFVKKQSQNIFGHFQSVETEHNTAKVNLLLQVKATNGFGQIDYSYDENDVNGESEILNRILPALEGISGLLLVDDNKAFIDHTGRLILNSNGDCEYDDFFVYDRYSEISTDGLSDEQVSRRTKSLDFLESRLIYTPKWLPVIEDSTQAKIRTTRQMAERTVALMVVSMYAECILAQNMSPKKARKYVAGIIGLFDAQGFFSPAENAFMQNSKPAENEAIQFIWQYENCYVMEWALGLIPEIVFPSKICDVPSVVKTINPYGSIDEILNASKPRSTDEFLDQADLIYRLDWACVEARINSITPPAMLDSGIVMERHKTLNWLIGSGQYDDDDHQETPADAWDNVDIST